MLKKITILLLGLVVLAGCSLQATDNTVDEETDTNQQIFTDDILDEYQDKFYLLDSFENVNFDYNKIEKFYYTCDEQYSIIPVLSPIEGEYNIDYFINTFKAEEFYDHPGGIQHAILAIKTNNNDEILDAYHYIYEWDECPRSSGLYKANYETLDNNKILLKNRLDIGKLNLAAYNEDGSVTFKAFDHAPTISLKTKSKIDFSFKVEDRDEVLVPLNRAKPFTPFCYLTKQEYIAGNFSMAETSFRKSEKNGIYYSANILSDYESKYGDIDYHLAEKMNEYLNEKYDVPLCNRSNNYSAVRLEILELKTPGEANKELEEFKKSHKGSIEYKNWAGYTVIEYSGTDTLCQSYLITDKFLISLNKFPGNCDSEIYGYVMEYFENKFANFAEEYDIKPYSEETMDIKVYFSDTKDNMDLIDCHKTRATTRITPKTTAVASAALEQLFIGPTEKEIEDGLYPFNRDNKKMSDVIKRFFVIDDTIYIDWYDFSMKSPVSDDKPFFYNSSSGGCNVIPPLEDTLLQFPNIENVVYAFEGDPEAYYEWSQRGCVSYERDVCDPIPFQ